MNLNIMMHYYTNNILKKKKLKCSFQGGFCPHFHKFPTSRVDHTNMILLSCKMTFLQVFRAFPVLTGYYHVIRSRQQAWGEPDGPEAVHGGPGARETRGGFGPSTQFAVTLNLL